MVMEPPPPSNAAGSILSQSAGPVETNNNEPPPLNPNHLGREFVRQYYTVLNQGPQILHRFYSDDSCLIHGSLDRPGHVAHTEPVYGQENINRKILSMNFKDCHAKIMQVDAQETLGRGVVVQVTGELSNNGQPMRRFFQTFVLSPRSPTNYYVRNDIFRYQDEIFEEEEYVDVEKIDSSLVQENSVSTTGKLLDGSALDMSGLHHQHSQAQPIVNGNHHVPLVDGDKLNAKQALNSELDGALVSKVPVSNIAAEVETINLKNEPPSEALTAVSPIPPSGPQTYASRAAAAAAKQLTVSPSAMPAAPVVASTLQQVSAQSVEPTARSPVVPFEQPAQPQQQPPSAPEPLLANPIVDKDSVAREAPAPQPQRAPRPNRQQRDSALRESTPAAHVESEGSVTGDERGKQGGKEAFNKQQQNNNYPDEQQVFVGNLPIDITEDQLGKWFSQYGTIVDVRINRTNQKMNGNRGAPNYGFVTFEDPEIVQHILKQKPIFFDGHRFNVEEKRTQIGRPLNRAGSGAGQGPPMNRPERQNYQSGGNNYGPRQFDRDRGDRREFDRPRRDNPRNAGGPPPFTGERGDRRSQQRPVYNKQQPPRT